MRLLVLTEDYPSKGRRPQAYVHNRNIEYKSIDKDIEIFVLCFRAETDYIIDDINVITFNTYQNKYYKEQFDLLLSHAPNVRHHLRFLVKHQKSFEHIILFFHGHEGLRINKYYPKPYSFMPQSNMVFHFLQDRYDSLKLFLMAKFIKKYRKKLNLVFVSQWMMKEFFKNIKIKETLLKDRCYVIYNSIAPEYEIACYNISLEKRFDFVTIRTIWDSSKYCIDIVCKIARDNPDKRFLLCGSGEFFNYVKKPDNLEIYKGHLTHTEIITVLNQSKWALMPSRLDAQGVMACEMATFGIPVITSDLPVFKEIFDGFPNVAFIDNCCELIDIDSVTENLRPFEGKNEKYFAANTVEKELKLFQSIIEA